MVSRLAVGTAIMLLCGCAAHPNSAPAQPSTSGSPPSTSAQVPDRPPHTLVLNATGEDAKVATIKYDLDGKSVQTGPVSLPWRQSLTVPADGLSHTYSLEVDFSVGHVHVSAIMDGGELLTQSDTRSSGGSDSHADASVAGSVRG